MTFGALLALALAATETTAIDVADSFPASSDSSPAYLARAGRTGACPLANGGTFVVAVPDTPGEVVSTEAGYLLVLPGADFNLDGRVDRADLVKLLRFYGLPADAVDDLDGPARPYDLDESGAVDEADLARLRAAYGAPPLRVPPDARPCGEIKP